MTTAFDAIATSETILRHGTTVWRAMGAGPPVLLLHGYPETHTCWHRVAPVLASSHRVVMPDLPGYGDSDFSSAADDAAFSKRGMAESMVGLMGQLGHDRFAVVGHDRGARVAYRMALDHPEVVTALTVIDIVPTVDEWDQIDGLESIVSFHWPFLAQPGGLPEALIGGDPDRWVKHLMSSWVEVDSAISVDAMAEYLRCFRRPEVIAGTCADYRAGATSDLAHDREDQLRRHMIECPVLVLSSAGRGDLVPVWRSWARTVEGACLDGGHFLAEENPEAVLHHLAAFLRR